MSYTIPSDAHAAGDTGHISDHNNIADVLTGLDGGIVLSRYTEPAGATASTMPRIIGQTNSGTPTSGTLYAAAIGMRQNITVNNITFSTKTTAETGGSHCWYVLMDSGMVVRAVTADQTGATAMGSANTAYTFAVASPYTTTYSGLYYLGICVVATGMPTWAIGPAAPSAGLNALSPVLCGTSSAGQTTPPTVGTAMGALTSNTNYNLYSFTS